MTQYPFAPMPAAAATATASPVRDTPDSPQARAIAALTAMPPLPARPAVPLIGFGQVRHRRLRPRAHAFAYPGYFLLLPLRSLKAGTGDSDTGGTSTGAATASAGWAINRRGLISFWETDHGDGRSPAQGGALAWLDELLQAQGIHDATGEVWLHTYPRVLGFTFKPVSFWYCHRSAADQDGALRAIVLEVNNTFGERHCYVLDAPVWGAEQRTDKVFHVSPFNPLSGHYRCRFLRSTQHGMERTVARIDYYDQAGKHADSAGTQVTGAASTADATSTAGAPPAAENQAGALLQTSISGTLCVLNRDSLRRAFWRYPAMTFGVVLHIHLQALGLWLKKNRFFR